MEWLLHSITHCVGLNLGSTSDPRTRVEAEIEAHYQECNSSRNERAAPLPSRRGAGVADATRDGADVDVAVGQWPRPP